MNRNRYFPIQVKLYYTEEKNNNLFLFEYFKSTSA